MKLFFVKGIEEYDEEDPILVLADNKEEAEKLSEGEPNRYGGYTYPEIVFEDNSPRATRGKAGVGYELKKGIIWKQYNAG